MMNKLINCLENFEALMEVRILNMSDKHSTRYNRYNLKELCKKCKGFGPEEFLIIENEGWSNWFNKTKTEY